MRRLKPQFKIIIVALATIIGMLILSCFIYKINISRVSKNDEIKEITITSGSTYLTIANMLKSNNLIKSELFYKVYIKIHNPKSLQAGKYKLSENMSVKEIVNTLSLGSTYNPNVVSITFREGINMRAIAKLIADNTNNTVDDVYNTLSDAEYLDSVIDKYWFIDESIKNKNIYYSLEGYLFPDTYSFNKSDSVQDIFDTMLANMGKQLEKYRDKLESSSYSIHEILTLASIVELEGFGNSDRNGIASVLYNRLKSRWALDCDVTTYYGLKLDMPERDLYMSELLEYNSYNTRSSKMAGKLPVSPICIPGLSSIDAAINPIDSDYYFFVADKNNKVYFSKTMSEHDQLVANLKEQGLWFRS